MSSTQSRNSVMEAKPRKITSNNTQITTTQRRKIYSELPMIDIQNTCTNIPAIDLPAHFSKDLMCSFPNDLEQSFHLGLLSACAAVHPVPFEGGLRIYQCSDKIGRSENKSILQHCIQNSDSGCGKYALDCKDEDRIIFNEQSTRHFMKDGKLHQTYLSKKRTSKTGQQHLMTKRFLKTCDLAEDIAYCETKEKSDGCENTTVLTQGYKNQVPTETNKSRRPEHHAFSSKLASESEPGNIFTVQVISKREKHVTFADEVNEMQMSESEKCHTSDEADLVKFAASEPKFCEADEHPVVTSDWIQTNKCPEDSSDFSDPPFPLSQKYGNHEIVFEEWKLIDQDDLQEVKLYEDHVVQ